MSSQQGHSVSPPPVPASSANSGVRRHHTISASSRGARPTSKIAVSELEDPTQNEQIWNDDELVDQDWVGGIGAVGEKSSLHRQASLPTRYHRAFGGQARQPGNHTPRTLNSLSAIAGHEGDEEEWEREMRGLRNDEDHSTLSSSDHGHSVESSNASPLSPHFAGGIPNVPSPPPPAGAAGVRRHQSLNYPTATGAMRRLNQGLKRAGTLQAPVIKGSPPGGGYIGAQSPSPTNAEEEYDDESVRADEDSYFGMPTQQGNDWRTQLAGTAAANIGSSGVDDVSRALNALELSSQYGSQQGMRNGGASQKLQLVTDLDERRSQETIQSASAYVPPIGHGFAQQGVQQSQGRRQNDRDDLPQQPGHRERAMTASGGTSGWDQKERMQGKDVPNVPPIPSQYLNNQGPAPRMGAATPSQNQQSRGSNQGNSYNPVDFDTRPPFARFFVIKSYTEDDVHKSLKYEIWSSTDPGNKRLDKAFKETASRGPIYLFFSVNASGHFCGMAEMLTPVDYTRSSTVWASDKWKGVFKVRWIFVRDIPNASLRHIRLNNTQERKPVTNSRDTQELLPDAGQEMLRIFHTHPARTSLLQDFAFYELQAMQKAQTQQVQQVQGIGAMQQTSPSQNSSALQSPASQTQSLSPPTSPGQHPFAMSNPAALAYAAQHMGMPGMNMNMGMGIAMNPMLQMQMNMGTAFANPHAMQSVMRHPSPGPMPVGQNFMGMGGMQGF
ncbi:hypothetical protein ABKN59_004014 [Abortiporus biennis]